MAILEMEEIMKKKILAGILTGLLAVGVLAGCGGEQGGEAQETAVYRRKVRRLDKRQKVRERLL